MRIRISKLAVLATALCLAAPAATGKDGVDAGEALDYYVVDQDVRQVLREIERATGVRYAISNQVRGRLKSVRLVGAPAEIMGTISERLSLDWFIFNGVLHVSARTETQTRLVRLEELDADLALTTLRRSGLPTAAFPSQITGDGAALALTGPPAFLALAETVLESLPPKGAPLPPAEPVAPQIRKTVVERRGVERQIVEVK